jgi:hypothetical protein
MSAGSAAAISAGAARGDARRIGVLFMVGSACFATASLPAASTLSEAAVGVVYFVGSIFFTTAAFEQLRVARGEGKEVWAAGIQFAGTLFFNVSTFFAMSHHLSGQTANLLVWSPDVFGSICFLVSSVLAELAVWGPLVPARRSASLNLIGSLWFGISAVAAYVVPDTNELLNASLATSTTLLGALCFLWAARILVKPPPWLLSRGAEGTSPARP